MTLAAASSRMECRGFDAEHMAQAMVAQTNASRGVAMAQALRTYPKRCVAAGGESTLRKLFGRVAGPRSVPLRLPARLHRSRICARSDRTESEQLPLRSPRS